MLDTTNIFTEYPDIVTTNQMSTMLNIGKNKVYELLNNNEIESIKLGNTGRKHYIPKINIISYLNRKNIKNWFTSTVCCGIIYLYL